MTQLFRRATCISRLCVVSLPTTPYVCQWSICSYSVITSLDLQRVEPSEFHIVLKSHFDPIVFAPKSVHSSFKLTGEKVTFCMRELLSSLIAACRYSLSGLRIAFLYPRGSWSIVLESSALWICSEAFTCVLLFVTLSVSTGALFDHLVVATTDLRDCLWVMTLSVNGAWWWDLRVGQ